MFVFIKNLIQSTDFHLSKRSKHEMAWHCSCIGCPQLAAVTTYCLCWTTVFLHIIDLPEVLNVFSDTVSLRKHIWA